ncbi:MAG: hypothetical protein WBL62_06895 [Gallionella sp.]
MMDKDVSNAQIMHALGQLAGSVSANHQGVTARVEDIRRDIVRIETATREQINRMEDSVSKQITAQGVAFEQRIGGLEKVLGDKVSSLSTRVSDLEKSEKTMLHKIGYVSGAAGVLVAGAVELLKHL